MDIQALAKLNQDLIYKKSNIDKATILRRRTNDLYDLSNGMVSIHPFDTERKFSEGQTVLLDIPIGNKQATEIIGKSDLQEPEEELDLFDEIPTCFLAGTMVKAITGEIEIEKIKEGDYVLGYDEKNKKIVQCRVNKLLIHNKESEKVTEYYVLKTENSRVRVTKNHPFYVGNNKYKQIQQINDYIYLLNNDGIIKEKIISKELVLCQKTITYNLSLDSISPCNYFANNCLVHNVTSKG